MEKYVTLLLSCLLTLTLIRLVSKPIRAAWQVLGHSAGGLFCLCLLNSVSGVTGLIFPMNAVTVLTAGFGGIPGVALLVLLETL